MNLIDDYKNTVEYLYVVNYLKNNALVLESSRGFDTEEEAMQFVKAHMDKIIYFSIDKHEFIFGGSVSVDFDVVKGKRQYLGEVYTKERIEKEETDNAETILRRLNGYNVELAVKPYNSSRYEYLLPGEKVYNKEFKQVYPVVKTLVKAQQKSR